MTDKKKAHMLRKLFIATFYLSAFTFGGGYVIVTLMKKKFVDEYEWIDDKEMLDMVAIAQSAPGAIAVNAAIVIGYRLAGLLGMLVCILATILPPFIIIGCISFAYQSFASNLYIKLILEGMQAGVGAVIASIAYDMGNDVLKTRDVGSIVIMLVAFMLNYYANVNAIYIIVTCIGVGILRMLRKGRMKS